jgi:23S rRNA (adenine2503-C2)-methyltransferase
VTGAGEFAEGGLGGGPPAPRGRAPRDPRPQLKDFAPERLREELVRRGIEGWRAGQIAAWLYARGVDDPLAMTDLAAELRERLAAEFQTRALEVDALARSADGTVKGRLVARDGAVLESVLIPEDERTTLCVSTQVGCPLECSFCATGALGFTRNLSTAEILDQVCRMREGLDPGRRLTNLVFMGMGEPLLNLPAVLEAIRTLVHPKGFALAPRRVTVSTVGVVPKLETLLAETRVNLAVSLHAADDRLRDALVPLNRRFPLDVLLGALRASKHVTPRRPVFFEVTLLAGVNDAPEHARAIVRRVRGIPCKVNVIPMNAHPDSPYRPPDPATTDRFTAELAGAGLRVTLRRSRGADIEAACGQLANRGSRSGRSRDHPDSARLQLAARASRSGERPPREPG